MFFAVGDFGSNTFRLQISKLQENSFLTIDVLKENVRLAGGLDKDNKLDEKTVQKALDCFARFGERLKRIDKAKVRLIGTNTLRVMNDAEGFLEKARSLLGTDIEIVSGREEARLIFNGVSHALPSEKKRLVIDIGGGSTEIIQGSGFDVENLESLGLGCVVFSKKFFNSYFESNAEGVLFDDDFQRAILAARTKLEAVDYRFKDWEEVILTSGTARALRDMFHAMQLGSNADEITLEGMLKLKDILVGKRVVFNDCVDKSIKGLKIERAPIIPGGLCIMIAIFINFGIEKARVVDAAMREGMLYDMVDRVSPYDLRSKTVEKMMSIYQVDEAHCSMFAQIAKKIYLNLVKDPQAERIKRLEWAAKLHSTGLAISHNGYHKHSRYIVVETDMFCFSKTEQQALADLILVHRSSINLSKSRVEELGFEDVLSFRFAFLLCRSHNDYSSEVENWSFKIVEKEGKKILRVEGARKWINNHPLTLYSIERDNIKLESFGLGFELSDE